MQLVTQEQLAERWNISPSTLAKARVSGDGPPFLKLGRSVRYDVAEAEQWLEDKRRSSTSQQVA
jgi:predicted DNA-binding transcriptional regulator AlpA